jgi:hypothetical protein
MFVVPIRLAGGSGMFDGRAEFYDATTDTWGTICDTNFNVGGWPSVFCLEREYGYAISAYTYPDSVSGPITLENPACGPGNTDKMINCNTQTASCDHSDDVYLKCEGA